MSERNLQHVLRKLGEYAEGRRSDVARGAETKELAAVLLEKYGYGLADATAIFIDNHASTTVYHSVDRLVAEIDPAATENRKKRWNARPADLSSSINKS